LVTGQKSANRPRRIPGIGNFDKSPPSESAVIIDGLNPQVFGSRDLGGFLFVSGAGDFQNEVDRLGRFTCRRADLQIGIRSGGVPAAELRSEITATTSPPSAALPQAA